MAQEKALQSGSNASRQAPTGSSSSPLRHRSFNRVSTLPDFPSPLSERRGSLLSDSVDDARQSIRSSTDDLLLPKAKGRGYESHHETSHWHSAPLALALLPAVGGLFFKNGGALITDITLLALAAVFLNWSVRLPWDWYCSAQSIRVQGPSASDDFYANDTIIEEDQDDEDEGRPKSPIMGLKPAAPPLPGKHTKNARLREGAESELRLHELTALFACFVFPAIGAWLLHAIRSQLSRPSEGLVSNYNLTIFLLAAELRPLSHLIKMVQSRTLHLQRVVSSNPYEEEKVDNAKVFDLSKRLDELEAHVANTSAANSSNGGSKPLSASQLSIEVRKDLQPELDALNRAVRRYEKRATILTMQIEARLQDIESRMTDALALAAAAERSSSNAGRGSALLLLDWMCAVVVFPVQAGWTVVSLPARVAGRGLAWVEEFIRGKVRKELRTAGRSSTHTKAGGARVSGRGSKKSS